jgi:hypothetical protein
MKTMKGFWNDCGQGVSPDSAVEIDLAQVQDLWSDMRGIEGNFFGLIDKEERTLQFYWTDAIPDDIEDARHLDIVLLDFPVPENNGSYSRQVTIGEVHALIATAFEIGADHASFPGLSFASW